MSKKPQVFISYAWESDAFRDQVRALRDWLMAQGITVVSDFDHAIVPPQIGLQLWMQHAVEDSAVVLAVCSPQYKLRFEKRAPPTDGKGVTWEAVFMMQSLYNRAMRNEQIYPIFPDPPNLADCPTVLEPWSNGHAFPSCQANILALVRACLKNVPSSPPGLLLGPSDSRLQPRDGRMYGRAGEFDHVLTFLRDGESAEGVCAMVVGVDRIGNTEICKAALKQWLAEDVSAQGYFVALPEHASAADLLYCIDSASGLESLETIEQLQGRVPPGLYYIDNLDGVAETKEAQDLLEAFVALPNVRVLASSCGKIPTVLRKTIAIDVLSDDAMHHGFRPDDDRSPPQPGKKFSYFAVADTMLALSLYWFLVVDLKINVIFWLAVTTPALLLGSTISNDKASRLFLAYQSWVEEKDFFFRHGLIIFCTIYLVGKLAIIVEKYFIFKLHLLCVGQCDGSSVFVMGVIFSSVIISGCGGILFGLFGRTGTSAFGVMFVAFMMVISILWVSSAMYAMSFVVGYFLSILFSLPYIIGIWLRAALLKTACNFFYIKEGIRELPNNWHRIVFLSHVEVDEKNFSFAPANLTGNPFYELSVAYKLWQYKKHTNYHFKFVTLFQVLVWAQIGWAYRYAIKGTCWVWWPLAFAITPLNRREDLDLLEDAKLHRMRLDLYTGKVGMVIFSVILLMLVHLAWPQVDSGLGFFYSEFKTISEAFRASVKISPNSYQWIVVALFFICMIVYLYLVNRIVYLHKEFVDRTESRSEDEKLRFSRRVGVVNFLWNRIIYILLYLISLAILFYTSSSLYPAKTAATLSPWFVGGNF